MEAYTIEKALCGDADAIRRLYDAHRSLARMFGLKYRISRDDAEAIYNEKFMTWLRTFRPGAAVFSAWIKRCLVNAMLTFNRDRQKENISLDRDSIDDNLLIEREQDRGETVNLAAFECGKERIYLLCSALRSGHADRQAILVFERFLNLRRQQRSITKKELFRIKEAIGCAMAQPSLFKDQTTDDIYFDRIVGDFAYLLERALFCRLEGHSWRDIGPRIGEPSPVWYVAKKAIELSLV